MAAKHCRREERLKEIRLKISRSRRRFDRHARAVTDEAHRLQSWKAYVRSFPGSAVLAAMGVGLAIAGGWNARSIARWLGGRLIQQAWMSARGGLVRELHALWVNSTPQPQPNPRPTTDEGASHE